MILDACSWKLVLGTREMPNPFDCVYDMCFLVLHIHENSFWRNFISLGF
jgi:hypothetical protein